MKINFLGDSITAGAFLDSANDIYSALLCNMLGATEQNYGISGTRIARQTKSKPGSEEVYDKDFLLRAGDMADADFTFVFGGTNDYGHGDAPMGSPEDKTPYTFYGALNLLCELLVNKFGKDKLCFILPLPRFSEDNPFGDSSKEVKSETLSGYRSAMVERLNKFGIDYLDMTEDFPLPQSNAGDEYFVDGLHPNKNGHRVIAENLRSYLVCKIGNRNNAKADEACIDYASMHKWEVYTADAALEYMQCVDEGLEVEQFKDLFTQIQNMPRGAVQKQFGDALFELVKSLKIRKGYKYIEPSELESIKSFRKEYKLDIKPQEHGDYDKVYGAWMGRICGCMLGKPIEGIRTNVLIPFLKDTDNYPMHRYIYRSELTDEICEKYSTFPFRGRIYADEINYMPWDDDANYIVLGQCIIEKYGKNFTAENVAQAWLEFKQKNAYCTAERVAFCNYTKGYKPPYTAYYQNPYREWIGAQIRADYYGYVFPGDPEKAAEAAFKDASISHVKNGIYGEMFVAAALAIAACTDNMLDIIKGALSYVPVTSRFYEQVYSIVDMFEAGKSKNEVFAYIHEQYDEYSGYGWCHTISNAMIVVAALLFGDKDYGKTICYAVETGYDTDCNGATVGSIFGMAHGISAIPEYWRNPINDSLETLVHGVGTVKVSDRVKLNLKHIED